MPHVLVTTDAVGGVWTHIRELAPGIVRRGWRVTVAVFGPEPRSGAAGWARPAGIELLYGGPGLEWMPGAEAAVQAGQRWLRARIAALRPDVLHATQFAAAASGGSVPCVLAVHSDVVSWWRAVHGCRPPSTAWIQFYRRTARAGLAAAAVLLAPTRAALADLRASFGTAVNRAPVAGVIANGMDAAAWGAAEPGPHDKQGYAAAAGRWWDEGKQIALLGTPGLAMPVRIAGPRAAPGAAAARPRELALPAGVEWVGELDRTGLKAFLAGADIFIVPSRYEPFGLGALEAALSGCALLLNDIPSLREVWGEAAAYFRGDGSAVAAALRRLAADPARQRALARAAARRAHRCYGARMMADRYAAAYARALTTPGPRPRTAGPAEASRLAAKPAEDLAVGPVAA